jgi:hypothetical protein
MMNRMLGFAGVCAAAGVLAGPANGIIIEALSSAAQERLSQPAGRRGGVSIEGRLWSTVKANMMSLSHL